MKKLITERDIIAAWQRRETSVSVPPGANITPAARDAARMRDIELCESIQSAFVQSKGENTSPPKVILGSDHGGFELKEAVKKYLTEWGVECEDIGTHSGDPVDYPDFAHEVAVRVARGHLNQVLGIIVDGAGVGSAMVANKLPGVRAASCQDVYTARNSRAHNNANVLTLGSRVLGPDVARDIVKMWLSTPFEGGRHARRVDKINNVDDTYRRT